jgi:hypothetical protein
MESKTYSHSNWKGHALHPKTADSSTCDWIFLIDLLNFSFWSEKSELEPYTVSYNNRNYTGYWTLCAAIRKALENGVSITSPAFYSTVSDVCLSELFAPVSPDYQPMPMLSTRCIVMRKAGTILVEVFTN